MELCTYVVVRVVHIVLLTTASVAEREREREREGGEQAYLNCQNCAICPYYTCFP